MGFFFNNDLLWGVGIRRKEGGRKRQCICHRFRKKSLFYHCFCISIILRTKESRSWTTKPREMFSVADISLCAQGAILSRGEIVKRIGQSFGSNAWLFCVKVWAFLYEPRFIWPHRSPEHTIPCFYVVAQTITRIPCGLFSHHLQGLFSYSQQG